MDRQVRLLERGAQRELLREIPLTLGQYLIGRGVDCDLRLACSDISRHHCLVRIATDEVTLTDLGSQNGTFCNGQRVRSQITLQSGDEIQIGSFTFVIDLGDRLLDSLGFIDLNPAAATIRRVPKPQTNPSPTGDR